MSQTPETPHIDGFVDRFFGRVYWMAAGLTMAGVLTLTLWGAPDMALNLGLGALMSGFAIRYTQRLVQRYLVPGDRIKRQRWYFMALMLAKLPLLVIVFFLVVQTSWFHPGGFLLGVSMLPGLIGVYGGVKARTIMDTYHLT